MWEQAFLPPAPAASSRSALSRWKITARGQGWGSLGPAPGCSLASPPEDLSERGLQGQRNAAANCAALGPCAEGGPEGKRH